MNKKETNEAIRALERWTNGVPMEEQAMIRAVRTVCHLAKLYIAKVDKGE